MKMLFSGLLLFGASKLTDPISVQQKEKMAYQQSQLGELKLVRGKKSLK